MRVLVSGDLHGNWGAAWRLVKAVEHHKPDYVWQVGDFGYWPKVPGNETFLEVVGKAQVPVYFADGNHEDHEALSSWEKSPAVTHLAHNIYHVSRGMILTQQDTRVLFFGGARSVDRTYRTPGVNWFSEELPNYVEWDRATSNDPVDYVVAHDVPLWVDFGYPSHEQSYWPMEDLRASEFFRRDLSSLASDVTPKIWFGGHHHRRKTAVSGDIRVEVLNCDGHPGTFVVLDTETGEVLDVPSLSD